MENLLGVLVGIGLSAACGFRVFVPMLALSIAALTGFFPLGSSFAWLGTWPALIAFACATLLEIGAYYIPWLDNLLDSIMTPLAIAAGITMTAALGDDLHPLLKWSLAVIAGGGISGLIQSGTVALRAGSTATTGGLANPIVSTLELMGSVLMVILALLIPVLAIVLAIALCAKMGQVLLRKYRRKS